MSLRPLLRNSVIVFAVLLASVLTLAGCFGGGQVKPPKPQVVSISGTVTAPYGTPVAFAPSAAPLAHLVRSLFTWCSVAQAAPTEEPVPGATVVAVNFADGKQVGTTATTDVYGRFTISELPKDIDIVVIATKAIARRTGARVRLSTLVPNVGVQNAISPDIGAVSTIAAEAWGVLYRRGLNIGPQDFTTTLDAARKFVDSQPSLDLTEGGGILQEQYGAGLAPGSGTEGVQETVPSGVDSRVWPAKEMVKDLRDAGLSLKGTYEHQLQVQSESIKTKVGPYLSEVGGHVGALHPWIIHYEPGVYQEDEYGWLELVQPGPDWRWLIHRYGGIFEEEWTATVYTDPATGVTVLDTASFKVTRPSLSGFTFWGNLDLDYTAAGNSTLPVTGTFTAKLQDTTVPILAQVSTFDGQYTGEFNSNGTAGHVELGGEFASAVINATGTLSIDGDTNSGIAELNFSGALTTDAAHVQGRLEVAVVRSTVIPETMVPRLIAVHGDFKEPGAAAPLFQGDFEITIDNASLFNFNSPTSPSNWPKGHVQFGGYVEAQGQPRVSATMRIETQEYLRFSSTVHYEHNASTLDGTITYDGNDGVAHINITNQAGLVTTMVGTGFLTPAGGQLSGTIKSSSGDKLADVVTDADGIVRVQYVDGSCETLL